MLYTVLVNWNGVDDTIACLRSLAETRHHGLTVLVCDNASDDGSVAGIAAWADAVLRPVIGEPPTQLDARVRAMRFWERADGLSPYRVGLIENRGNLGFAGGNNVGVAVALADRTCRYVFLLNNDTEIDPDALLALERRMENSPDLALCGATLIYHGRPNTLQGLGGTYNRFTARAGALFGDQPLAKLPDEAAIDTQIDFVIGAAIFARAEVFRRTGGLNENYFLFYEELDLSRQLLPGERMGWARDARVRHKVGGSIGTGDRKTRGSDLGIYYNYRSKTRYYWTYLRPYVPFLISDLFRTSLAYLRRGDLRAVKVVWLGLYDFFTKPAAYRRDFSTRRSG